MAAVIDYLDELEIGVCLRINQLGKANLIRRFFAVVSRLGDWYFWAAMGALLFAIEGPSSVPAIVQILITSAIGILVYKILKQRLVRERPFVHSGSIQCGAAPLDRYSFPSGHTLHAVNITIMLVHADPLFLTICLPFALLVALSRVILGLHYPSDVLVGAVIGATLGYTSVSLI